MLISGARAPTHVQIRLGLVAISLIACALTLLAACVREPVSAPRPPNTPLPAPQPAAAVRAPDAPSTLDELIFLSNVIARVTLNSAESHVIADPPGTYTPALKFRFQVIEYLKGDGDTELTVEVPLDAFNVSVERPSVSVDRPSAEATAEAMADARDRSWDGRESIVLLGPSNAGQAAGASGPMMHRFTGPEYPVNIYQYAITSGYNRVWLPAADPSGSSGAVGSAEPEYLTGPPYAQSQGATGSSSANAPTISLSEINKRIKANDDLLAENRDVQGYEECIRGKFRYDAYVRNGHFKPFSVDANIPSGQSEGYRLSSKYQEGEYYSKWWTTGPDSDLFVLRMVDDSDGDPSTGFVWEHVATRPIPRGVYRIFYNVQSSRWIPCNYNPESIHDLSEIVVTVTAPDGALHEAFFDPVDMGTAVGADAANGVLKPAFFTLEGVGSVNINRIGWKLGKVELELDPHSASGFANHHMDFIALDGSVTLRLDLNDAAEVEQDGTRALAWNVCDQPWESGDLLMLRMSASGEDLIGVTNNGPCSPPAPQNLAATSTHDSVTLTWDAPDDPTVTGHRIFRRVVRQETFVEFEISGTDATTYVDTTDIQPGTKYIYRVHAVNDAGISEVARIAVTTLAAP